MAAVCDGIEYATAMSGSSEEDKAGIWAGYRTILKVLEIYVGRARKTQERLLSLSVGGQAKYQGHTCDTIGLFSEPCE